MKIKTLENIEIIRDRKESSINPRKFIVWLFIATIVMLFAALTSAYLVKQGEGNWLHFEIPDMFWVTSVVIILSSISMQFAYISAKKDNISWIRGCLLITMVLGLAFLAGQYLSWGELVRQDVFFVGNPAGSFIYVLTGLHAVHLISGIIFLAIVLYSAFKYRIHAKNLNSLEMSVTYWHFLGGLWLYLFFFLKIYH
ncbi:MAG: cytochrome c oxidase subunit 3 [Cyclobacteriaceae bacterium]|nr:cytochrome c oxidase subunit 3 [Cyclobacteriaceae bacterium]